MKIYLLEQDQNSGYDTYDSCVVCAENEEDAKTIHPSGCSFVEGVHFSSWARNADSITCKEIGEANENQQRGVIIASYNAG